jgi:hypothetical protein
VAGALLYELLDEPEELRQSVDLALPKILQLQPEGEREKAVLNIASLAQHLDRGEIDRLEMVANATTDQQKDTRNGDTVLQAVAPVLVGEKSLHAGRLMAQRIVAVDPLVTTCANLIDVYLAKLRPEYDVAKLLNDKLPRTIAMNTALPAKQ